MKFDRDGRRTYRNWYNCLDTELTPAHIFDCPAVLAAVQEIGVFFSSTNLYVDNISQIARTVIWVHGGVSIYRVEVQPASGSGNFLSFSWGGHDNQQSQKPTAVSWLKV
ncbi:uncharacterized protein TNCV_3147631 [Trichonephila clavipes]|nr:uncharacterized protein TNCV_3147631 [Trichonephila clavipes]